MSELDLGSVAKDRQMKQMAMQQAAKYNLEFYMEHNINVANNFFTIVGSIDQSQFEHCLRAVTILDITSPMTIYLNTEGGDLYQGLAIFDLLKDVEELHIICTGEVASAGTIVLQAANYRSATGNCQFLVHYGTDGAESDNEAKHNRKMFRRMKDLLAARVHPKSSKASVGRWHSKETFFSAEEALKKGLIDELV